MSSKVYKLTAVSSQALLDSINKRLDNFPGDARVISVFEHNGTWYAFIQANFTW